MSEDLPPFVVGVPGDPEWTRITDALDPAWIGAQLAALRAGEDHGPRPGAVAGAYLSAGFSWVVTRAAMAGIHELGRCPDLAPDNVAVRVDNAGWVVELAVAEDRTIPLADLPQTLIATLDPVFRAIRGQAPYGMAGMWGALADHLAEYAWRFHERGASRADLDAAWHLAEQVADAVARQRPVLRSRPTRFALRSPDGAVMLPMRSTCCLWYRTPEADAGSGDGYCTTCPLRPDDERVRLVEANLAAGRH